MITVIRLDIANEDLIRIAENQFGRSKPVSRKELTQLVEEYVNDIITIGAGSDQVAATSEVQDLEDPEPQLDAGRDRRSDRFVPSRGDEPYLLKARDPELRDILSRMLDVSEEYEAYVWRKHNENRIDESKSFPRGD